MKSCSPAASRQELRKLFKAIGPLHLADVVATARQLDSSIAISKSAVCEFFGGVRELPDATVKVLRRALVQLLHQRKKELDRMIEQLPRRTKPAKKTSAATSAEIDLSQLTA